MGEQDARGYVSDRSSKNIMAELPVEGILFSSPSQMALGRSYQGG